MVRIGRADVHNSVQDIMVTTVFYSFVSCVVWNMDTFSRLDGHASEFYRIRSAIVIITDESEICRGPKSDDIANLKIREWKLLIHDEKRTLLYGGFHRGSDNISVKGDTVLWQDIIYLSKKSRL